VHAEADGEVVLSWALVEVAMVESVVLVEIVLLAEKEPEVVDEGVLVLLLVEKE